MEKHQIATVDQIKKFVFGGNSTFTVQNINTGKRFTFKVKTLKGDKHGECWFVNVLTGPNNEHDYTYMGMVDKQRSKFFRTQKSKVLPDALSYKGFDWFFKMLKFNVALPEYVQVYHEGRCGRCGRKLTTPASIEAGFGPECINK